MLIEAQNLCKFVNLVKICMCTHGGRSRERSVTNSQQLEKKKKNHMPSPKSSKGANYQNFWMLQPVWRP